jgi:hypothetical protein
MNYPVSTDVSTQDTTRGAAADTASSDMAKSRLLILTTSLLTDRMLWYSGFFPQLRDHFDVTTWAWGSSDPRVADSWNAPSVALEDFPAVEHFRMFPHTYLRRLNELVWDHRLQPPSRLSHRRHVEDRRMNPWMRTAKIPARVLAAMKLEQPLERLVGGILQGYLRSPQALARLESDRPSLVLATGPMRFEEPAVVAIARNLNIPTLALITSWDNLSTKKRMLFDYDGYIVWSEQMRRELHHFYPATRKAPVYVVGAPQFDVFLQDEFRQTREAFCADNGLRPEAPIILYTLGSPNNFKEYYGAVDMAQRITRGELGDVQLLVRPHPIFDNDQESSLLGDFKPRVIVQRSCELHQNFRSQARTEILQWVNTFRHADVVVNLASTTTVDAAIFDRPVVNLDYDPEPLQPNQSLVKDANHVWTHFKPIAESGGVWNVNNSDEMVTAIQTYLRQPDLHRSGRRWITEYVCGEVDGHAGARLAQALVSFAEGPLKTLNKTRSTSA